MVRQTFVQVVPPSIVTSTSASESVSTSSMKSLAHWMAAFALDERSIGGVTRYVSSGSKKLLSQLLLISAKGPDPPVRFPSKNWQGSAPSKTCQLAPETVSTVQPAGRMPASKLSEKTGVPTLPGP